jgi:hypothetical protein
MDEIAEALNIARRTVERDWDKARIYCRPRLAKFTAQVSFKQLIWKLDVWNPKTRHEFQKKMCPASSRIS